MRENVGKCGKMCEILNHYSVILLTFTLVVEKYRIKFTEIIFIL